MVIMKNIVLIIYIYSKKSNIAKKEKKSIKQFNQIHMLQNLLWDFIDQFLLTAINLRDTKVEVQVI